MVITFLFYICQFLYVINSVDSILLVEEGFDVTSVDASDKMLKYALKLRWLRRKEPPFDKWGKHYCGDYYGDLIEFNYLAHNQDW